MRTNGNLGRTPSYWPNSKGKWTDQPALDWTGVDDDHYEQPGDLFRMMTDAQKQVLFENTARAMGDARA